MDMEVVREVVKEVVRGVVREAGAARRDQAPSVAHAARVPEVTKDLERPRVTATRPRGAFVRPGAAGPRARIAEGRDWRPRIRVSRSRASPRA